MDWLLWWWGYGGIFPECHDSSNWTCSKGKTVSMRTVYHSSFHKCVQNYPQKNGPVTKLSFQNITRQVIFKCFDACYYAKRILITRFL